MNPEQTICSELAVDIFRRATRAGIDYALMRNHREVLSGTAKDADILVAAGDLRRFAARIEEAARSYPEWSIIQVVRSRFGRRVVLLHLDGCSLLFDLRSVVRLPAGLAPARHFLGGTRISPEGIKLLGREQYLTCLYLHNLFKPKPEYDQVLATAFRAEKKMEVRVRDRVEVLNRRYRDRLLRRLLRKATDVHYWRGYLRPPGFFTVVNGPDGVGKTTALSELQVRLTHLGLRSRVRHLGGKTGMLPDRPAAVRKRQPVSQRFSGDSSPASRFRVAADLPRLLYHFLDIQLYYWLVIRKFQAAGGWFIADKYFTYTVKAGEMGFSVPDSLVRVIYRLLPRPDLFILLWNDPGIISRRKSELTPREAAEHSRILERISRFARRRSMIKTDRSITRVAAEVQELLIGLAGERLKR